MALPLPLDQPTRLRPAVDRAAARGLQVVGWLFAHRTVRAAALVAVVVGTVVAWRAPGWSPLVVWTVASVVGWLVVLVASVRT